MLPPERGAPDRDDRVAGRLLAELRDDDSAPPRELAPRVIARIRDRIVLRDLIELATRGFARSLGPALERLAALGGVRPRRGDDS